MKRKNIGGLLAWVLPGFAIPIASQAAPDEPRMGETVHSLDSQTREISNSSRQAEKPRNSRNIEEVVVTAQRREQELQDVPISVSVLGGSDLDASTASGVTQALAQVPGVAATVAAQGGGTQITIRGVAPGGPLFAGPSAVAYYLDSVPFGLVKSAFAPDANIYDLQRIEVLRGPQGTLYGASALNGVVRTLTRDADLSRFDLGARTSYSATDGGGDNYRGDLAVNVPIVEGKLAARAVVGYQDSSGWIDRPNDRDANDEELRNMRLKINAQVSDSLSIGASAWSSRADYGAPSTGLSDGTNPSLADEPITTDYDLYGLRVTYKSQYFSLSSVTGYMDFNNESSLDVTPGATTPISLVTAFDATVLSQEIALNSSSESSWRWSAGLFYRDAKDHTTQSIPGSFFTAVDSGSKSYAVFGELGRRFLSDQFEWTLGLRYFRDDIFLDQTVVLPPINNDDSFHATTPRAVLSWYPKSRFTMYASYSEGFRSGSPQGPTVLRLNPGFAPVQPDKLHNWELGAKADAWEGRLSYEVAVYYIDWRDLQQQVLVPLGAINLSALVNGESASGVGTDLSIVARPTEALTLSVNGSWNDLSVDSDVFSAGVVLFREGDRVNYSPEYTVSAAADYVFSLGSNGYKGRFSASVNHTSEQIQRALASPAAGVLVSAGDPMTIAQTSFSIDTPDHWTATLFVDNVSNEDGSPTGSPTAATASVRIRPRTIGLQVEYRY